MVELVLAQPLSDDKAEEFRNALLASGYTVPERALTYADAVTVKKTVQLKAEHMQATTTTQVRNLILSRMKTKIVNGEVHSWRDLVGGLRVMGVPNAAPANETPGNAPTNARPQQFMWDDSGNLTENPDYRTWLLKEQGGNPDGAGVHINVDARSMLIALGADGQSLNYDEDGNVVGMVDRDGEAHSLQSMNASELHDVAYGRKPGDLGSSLRSPPTKDDDGLNAILTSMETLPSE